MIQNLYNNTYIIQKILFRYEYLRFLNISIITQKTKVILFSYNILLYNSFIKIFLFLFYKKLQKNIGYFVMFIII